MHKHARFIAQPQRLEAYIADEATWDRAVTKYCFATAVVTTQV